MTAPTLTFDAENHLYYRDGLEVPNVTRIIERLVDFDGIDPDVLQAKSELGKAVHEITATIDRGGEPIYPSGIWLSHIEPYVQAWDSFKAMSQPVFLAIEERVDHPTLGYAGTLDRIVTMNGHNYVVDLKCTSVISPWVGVQLAGYEAAWREQHRQMPLQRMAVQIRPDGEFRVHHFRNPDDWQAFKALLTVHFWRQKRGLL